MQSIAEQTAHISTDELLKVVQQRSRPQDDGVFIAAYHDGEKTRQVVTGKTKDVAFALAGMILAFENEDGEQDLRRKFLWKSALSFQRTFPGTTEEQTT